MPFSLTVRYHGSERTRGDERMIRGEKKRRERREEVVGEAEKKEKTTQNITGKTRREEGERGEEKKRWRGN